MVRIPSETLSPSQIFGSFLPQAPSLNALEPKGEDAVDLNLPWSSLLSVTPLPTTAIIPNIIVTSQCPSKRPIHRGYTNWFI